MSKFGAKEVQSMGINYVQKMIASVMRGVKLPNLNKSDFYFFYMFRPNN